MFIKIRSFLRYNLIYPLRSVTACKFGRHVNIVWTDGSTANFCAACHLQLNKNTYNKYRVFTINSELNETVFAVNENHARSFFIHMHSGYLSSNLLIKFIQVEREMTFNQWKLKMKPYLDKMIPVTIAPNITIKY